MNKKVTVTWKKTNIDTINAMR